MEKYIDWVVTYLGLTIFFVPMTAILGSVIYLGNDVGWFDIDVGAYVAVSFIIVAILSMFIEVDFEDA